jgi:hypothetical protein
MPATTGNWQNNEVNPMHQPDSHKSLSASAYPGLSRLGLTVEDLAELTQQGFLSNEFMRGTLRHKLRFRRPDGSQVVRYVRAADRLMIENELAELQTSRRAVADLRKAADEGRQALRSSKKDLEPVLAKLGFRFHGRAIRRPRKPIRASVPF